MVAYPLLAMQQYHRHDQLKDYAIRRLDSLSQAINPASGLFFDCQEGQSNHCDGWWTYLSDLAHYSYIQGHACYYLLRSARLIGDRPRWIAAARDVLERVLTMQGTGMSCGRQSQMDLPGRFS